MRGWKIKSLSCNKGLRAVVKGCLKLRGERVNKRRGFAAEEQLKLGFGIRGSNSLELSQVGNNGVNVKTFCIVNVG